MEVSNTKDFFSELEVQLSVWNLGTEQYNNN